MADTLDDPRIGAALKRNDRYVQEFVEAYNLCPYAKRCRESGRLHRVVLLATGGEVGSREYEAAVEALVEAIAEIERQAVESVEVALILLPALAPALAEGSEGARRFEELVAVARTRIEARHPNADTPFYCVAFHPQFVAPLRGEPQDVHRAVRFIRRSPDPTVQLVRASVLRAVRGTNPGGAQYVDVSGMSAAELMAVSAPISIPERIGIANLGTLNQAGPDRLHALLEDIAAHIRTPEP